MHIQSLRVLPIQIETQRCQRSLGNNRPSALSWRPAADPLWKLLGPVLGAIATILVTLVTGRLFRFLSRKDRNASTVQDQAQNENFNDDGDVMTS